MSDDPISEAARRIGRSIGRSAAEEVQRISSAVECERRAAPVLRAEDMPLVNALAGPILDRLVVALPALRDRQGSVRGWANDIAGHVVLALKERGCGDEVERLRAALREVVEAAESGTPTPGFALDVVAASARAALAAVEVEVLDIRATSRVISRL